MSLSNYRIDPDKKNISQRAFLFFTSLLVSLLVFALMHFFVVPFLFRVDSNLDYFSEVLSLDNFFDEESGKFLGEQRSVTAFGYDFVDYVDNTATVENFFNVRTLSGDTIIDVRRQYGIDKYSWSHVSGYGDKNRNGYLFAPRFIKKGDSFPYWHVNYDKELNMVFLKEEVINGVLTYRYGAVFTVDQTDDLSHLPGVPEERGVSLDTSLTLWVEPITGWLVKYEDSAIAYFYDINTGKRINPWNKFSNRYSKKSITKQADIAKYKMVKIVLLEFALPVSIFILLLSICLSNKRKKFLFILVGALLVAFGFYIWWQRHNNDVDPIVIGISRWVPNLNTAYEDNIKGFKDALADAGYKEGRDIVYIERTSNANAENQRGIASDFLEKNVDLIYSLTTPGTTILKDRITNRPIIFSIVTYPVESGLIDSLDNSGNNLTGTRNWIPVRDQLNIFLKIVPNIKQIGFVHREGESNSNIQLSEMRKATEPLGIEVVDIAAKDKNRLEQILSSYKGIDSVYSACDTLVQGEAEDIIISFAKSNKIPSFSCNISGPEKGDLLGVAADFYSIGKQSGEKAALILEGIPPTVISIDTVSRSSILINMDTANFLGISVPQHVIAGAARIIR